MNDIHSQRKEESRTSDAKSLEDLLQLHMSEIKEGHTFKKTDLLDSEDDTDYIDEYIDENPIEICDRPQIRSE